MALSVHPEAAVGNVCALVRWMTFLRWAQAGTVPRTVESVDQEKESTPTPSGDASLPSHGETKPL